jgi:hypothetical protein
MDVGLHQPRGTTDGDTAPGSPSQPSYKGDQNAVNRDTRLFDQGISVTVKSEDSIKPASLSDTHGFT